MGSRGDLQAKIDLNTDQKLTEIDQSMGGELRTDGGQMDNLTLLSCIFSVIYNNFFPPFVY